jgi:hypothetical protein
MRLRTKNEAVCVWRRDFTLRKQFCYISSEKKYSVRHTFGVIWTSKSTRENEIGKMTREDFFQE